MGPKEGNKWLFTNTLSDFHEIKINLWNWTSAFFGWFSQTGSWLGYISQQRLIVFQGSYGDLPQRAVKPTGVVQTNMCRKSVSSLTMKHICLVLLSIKGYVFVYCHYGVSLVFFKIGRKSNKMNLFYIFTKNLIIGGSVQLAFTGAATL